MLMCYVEVVGFLMIVEVTVIVIGDGGDFVFFIDVLWSYVGFDVVLLKVVFFLCDKG